MTETEYRNHPGINKSTLWQIRKSPAHYRAAVDHQGESGEDRPALKLGRAIHAAVLQPEEYCTQYVVAPELNRRTKEGRELYAQFEAENAGKEIISQADAEVINGIKAAISGNKAVKKLLRGAKAEVPIMWTDEASGLECKCRVDAFKVKRTNRKPVSITAIDLKSASDASTDYFAREAIKRGYDVQAAHYIHGLKAKYHVEKVDWYFIVIEKESPFAVNLLKASEGFLDNGEWRRMALMDRLQKSIQTDSWSGYGENDLILPAWAEYDGEWMN